MAVPVALGGWEGWARLIALGCAAASLALLFRLLKRSFEPRLAMVAVAAIATSGFLLEHGKLFNTLTLATPLFLLLLDITLSGRVPRWTPVVVVLLVLSSWDGVLGAGVLVAVLLFRSRAWSSAVAGIAAVAFVAWHLIDATGGTDELKWQLAWRAGGSEFTLVEWFGRQGEYLLFGLGPLTLALLLAPIAFILSPVEGRGRAVQLFLLAAAPGVLMILIFRQGAHRHGFWGFNLILPAAVALAMALTVAKGRAKGIVIACLVLQAGWSTYQSLDRLEKTRASNQVGALGAKRFGASTTVPMLTHYNYHPYVSWYAPARPDWALTREELAASSWPPQAEVLVDSLYSARLGCRPYPTLEASADGRWTIARAAELRAACLTPAAAEAPR